MNFIRTPKGLINLDNVTDITINRGGVMFNFVNQTALGFMKKEDAETYEDIVRWAQAYPQFYRSTLEEEIEEG